ncbi:MAG: GNAT family N-acetyltransferase [Ruminococcaceae bacterium]|nr:GNAT family N-acetyltransferase [Oscillospiraceae bacterium]
MKDLYLAARRLYEEAFPMEDAAFTDALFALCFPHHLVAMSEGGELCSMLFAVPYPIQGADGPITAHYLYAVATAKAHRGKGYAKRLLQGVASRGTPVFLRPMSPSLFDFYKSAGFTPFSPHREWSGEAMAEQTSALRHLSPEEYLTVRDGFLQPPFCRMTPAFLSLSFSIGGAVGMEGKFAALYEKNAETVFFKEWWGDPDLAPRAAAFLGAKRFFARTSDKNGTPFGMGINVPQDTVFLAAMD